MFETFVWIYGSMFVVGAVINIVLVFNDISDGGMMEYYEESSLKILQRNIFSVIRIGMLALVGILITAGGARLYMGPGHHEDIKILIGDAFFWTYAIIPILVLSKALWEIRFRKAKPGQAALMGRPL